MCELGSHKELKIATAIVGKKYLTSSLQGSLWSKNIFCQADEKWKEEDWGSRERIFWEYEQVLWRNEWKVLGETNDQGRQTGRNY